MNNGEAKQGSTKIEIGLIYQYLVVGIKEYLVLVPNHQAGGTLMS